MLEKKDIEMLEEIVEKVVKPVKEDIKTLKSDVKTIELTLENQTNRAINIIAEGHLDLSRKLDEALKINNEKEMLQLRVTILESELEKVKKRLAEIA